MMTAQEPTPFARLRLATMTGILVLSLGAGAAVAGDDQDDKTDRSDEDTVLDLGLDDRDWESFSEEVLLAVRDALAQAEEDLKSLEQQDFDDLPEADGLSLEAMKAAERAREKAMSRVNEAMAEAEAIRQREFEKAKEEIAKAREEIQAALTELRARKDSSDN